jgi:putative phage-type endonuclease
MIVEGIEQNTEAWLAWRKDKVGASDAAAILGKCKFNTAYGLFLSKTGRVEGFKGNAATERGHEIEPKARSIYEIRNGFIEMPPACVVHDEHSQIAASLDGLRWDRRVILQIKYTSQESHDLVKNEKKVPEHYWIQCQHELMCVPEAEVNDYMSYRDEDEALVGVRPDVSFQALLLQAELEFLELLRMDIPPPLTERDAKLVDDDPKIQEICDRLLRLRGLTGKASKSESDKLKAEVIHLGGHNRIRCGNVLISWNPAKEQYRMTVSGERSST